VVYLGERRERLAPDASRDLQALVDEHVELLRIERAGGRARLELVGDLSPGRILDVRELRADLEQAGALPLRLAENAGEHEPEHALGMVDRGCAAPPSCPSNGPR
jgi:hypothetical protein